MKSNRFKKLHSILAAEQSALVTAEFQVLQDIVSKKERVLSSDISMFSNRELQELRDFLGENSRIAHAAGRGLRAAAEKLVAIRSTANSLRVYGENGNFSNTSTKSVEAKL